MLLTREQLLQAVKQNGRALQFASAALKDDREIVLEAVKQNGRALEYVSAALKDDREIVLEAVKQNGNALQFASAGLRNGGLREYLNHLKSNVFNVPKQTFIATILFGSKAALSIPASPRVSQPRHCDNSKCVLSLLRPSVRVPGSMSLQIKKLIWEYAGVRSGPKWDVIDGALRLSGLSEYPGSESQRILRNILTE